MALEVNRLADPAARTLAVRTPTPRPTLPTTTTKPPQRPAITTARTELSQTRQVEARRFGETVQTANEQLGFAQAATAELDTGISALERLGELAAQAQDDPAPNPDREAEATAIATQLTAADQADSLQRVRQQLETTTAQREIERAVAEVEQIDDEAAAPPLPRQPTLALVPLGPTQNSGDRARAQQAVETAQRELARAESGGGAAPPAGEPRTAVFSIPVLEPASADVSTPAAAATTAVAVEDAVGRSSDLRDQVRLLGDGAAQRARGATRQVPNDRPQTRTLSDPSRAQDAAERAARVTVENPAQAIATQPFISVEAALRVLA